MYVASQEAISKKFPHFYETENAQNRFISSRFLLRKIAFRIDRELFGTIHNKLSDSDVVA